MKLYEYEAKSLFSSYRLPAPEGKLVADSQQAYAEAARLAAPVAVKAQVLVGGRGKAGGILFADTPKQAKEAAENLLGHQVKGLTVKQVLVEEKLPVKRELYFGITVDRFNRSYVAMASGLGGVAVEEISERQPQKIHKQLINPQLGFRSFQARQIVKQMGYTGTKMVELSEILEKLYHVSIDSDAELAEINPLVETPDGRFVVVDARLVLDDSALFRHQDYRRKQLAEPRDFSSQEFEAFKNGLGYVKLDGNIGVASNGAGLVMATMDVVNLYGGKPANFLDMGGGAPLERIELALKILLLDPEVKVLFVNILGGITLCDEVARAIIEVREKFSFSKPFVIRLVGVNEKKGKLLLTEAGMPVYDSMEEAAAMAVELARKEP